MIKFLKLCLKTTKVIFFGTLVNYLGLIFIRKFRLMKKIQAIVRASRFEDVKDALADKEINFFSFYEVKGYGHQKSESRSYRGTAYDLGYIPRIQLIIFLSEPFVESAIQAIQAAAYTGEKGDGLITLSNVDEIINIRTGLKNSEAINK